MNLLAALKGKLCPWLSAPFSQALLIVTTALSCILLIACDLPVPAFNTPAILAELGDEDGDGWVKCSEGRVDACDCDDAQSMVFPGGNEGSEGDGKDNDCDGDFDEGTTAYDDDGDGFSEVSGDCDDADPSLYPGAEEPCDGNDNDCDEVTDEEGLSLYYDDGDGDGFGTGEGELACSPEPGRTPHDGDCNDFDPAVFPGAAELCNQVDDDCDEGVDEGVELPFYRDLDGDGYGDDSDATEACEAPEGYVANSEDCDDNNSAIKPLAEEGCDGQDNDCDSKIDEDVKDTFYSDKDGDGFGVPDLSELACAPSAGYAESNNDCDDTNPDINPDATEICFDGIDQDCVDAPCPLAGNYPLDRVGAQVTGVYGLEEEVGAGDRADNLGLGIPSAGDLNDDGCSDMVLASPHAYDRTLTGDGYDSIGLYDGMVYIIFGQKNGETCLPPALPLDLGDAPQGVTSLTVSKCRNDGQFGIATGVGDIDGDGNDDVVIGSYGMYVYGEGEEIDLCNNDDGSNRPGGVHVIYGPIEPGTKLELVKTQDAAGGASWLYSNEDDGIVSSLILYGEAHGDDAGTALAVAELNGDDCDDLVVGAPDHQEEGSDRKGKVYFILGGGQSGCKGGEERQSGLFALANAPVQLMTDDLIAEESDPPLTSKRLGHAIGNAGEVGGSTAIYISDFSTEFDNDQRGLIFISTPIGLASLLNGDEFEPQNAFVGILGASNTQVVGYQALVLEGEEPPLALTATRHVHLLDWGKLEGGSLVDLQETPPKGRIEMCPSGLDCRVFSLAPLPPVAGGGLMLGFVYPARAQDFGSFGTDIYSREAILAFSKSTLNDEMEGVERNHHHASAVIDGLPVDVESYQFSTQYRGYVSGVPDLDGDGEGDILLTTPRYGEPGRRGVGAVRLLMSSDMAPGDGSACEEGGVQARWFKDGDGDGYGAGEGVWACQPSDIDDVDDVDNVAYVASGGDCDDNDPMRHPISTEIRNDGLDQDCDGWEICHVSESLEVVIPLGGSCPSPIAFNVKDVFLDGPTLVGQCGGNSSTTVGNSDERFGAGVQIADVYDDGKSEILVGSVKAEHNVSIYDEDEGQINEVEAAVFGLSRYGHPSSRGIISVGDVSGDGKEDILISAPRSGEVNGSCDPAGAAYIIMSEAFSKSEGEAHAENWAINSMIIRIVGRSNPTPESDETCSDPATYPHFGFSSAGQGDFNGDGETDLIISAYREGGGTPTPAGAVYLILGPLSSLGDIDLSQGSWDGGTAPQESKVDPRIIRLVDIPGGWNLGTAVDFISDIDGDGFDEVLIAANKAGTADDGSGGTYRGVRSGGYIVYGEAICATESERTLTIGQHLEASFLGFEVASNSTSIITEVANVGDINNDGHDDIWVFQGLEFDDEPSRGLGFVMDGNGAYPDLRDGGQPIALNDLYDDETGQLRGRALLMMENIGTSTNFAQAGGKGDVNGDGIDDLILAPYSYDSNSAALFQGVGIVYGWHRDTPPALFPGFSPQDAAETEALIGLVTLIRPQDTDHGLGIGVAVGDYNSDGVDDLVLGAPRYEDPATLTEACEGESCEGCGVYNTGAAYVIPGGCSDVGASPIHPFCSSQGPSTPTPAPTPTPSSTTPTPDEPAECVPSSATPVPYTPMVCEVTPTPTP